MNDYCYQKCINLRQCIRLYNKKQRKLTKRTLKGFFKNKNKQTKKVSQSSRQGWRREIDLNLPQKCADAEGDILEW